VEHSAPDWERALTHPFVDGLAAGSLRPAQVRCYLEQDRLYLAGYVRVCRALAKRAEEIRDSELFEESARLSEEGEAGMQAALASSLGLDLRDSSPLPATTEYMRREQEALEDRSRLVALAGAAPCNLLYAETGRRLRAVPGTDRPDYPFRAWLDLYGDDAVQRLAERWVEILNRWAGTVTPAEQDRALDVFAAAVRCETAFWDQAWRA